jgi:bifunctional non-homologous end joining protein LigD
MKKSERAGRVFIDWSQNDRHKTTVGPYSLRALECPTVSTPLTWEEVEQREITTRDLDAPAVLQRLSEIGDPFAPVLEQEQSLPALG